ncbi:MAG: hypothetical protein AB7Q00_16275 [Phycisphaerales bacterium]
MGLFNRLWTAVASVVEATSNLANSLNGLARTFDQANLNVRQNLHMADETAALPEPEKPKGRKNVA